MNTYLEKLIDISVATRGHALGFHALEDWVDGSGYDGLTLLRINGLGPSYFASHAKEWENLYLRRRYSAIDPIVAAARRRRGIVAWNLASLAARSTPNIKKMAKIAAEFSIRSGFSLAVSIGFGHVAVFSLYSRLETQPDISDIDPVLLASAVTHLHTTLVATPLEDYRPLLKAQDLRCLRWTSEGRSISEVADLVGVSYSTARFFLDRAKQALGAVTLPQATALAKELQLI